MKRRYAFKRLALLLVRLTVLIIPYSDLDAGQETHREAAALASPALSIEAVPADEVSETAFETMIGPAWTMAAADGESGTAGPTDAMAAAAPAGDAAAPAPAAALSAAAVPDAAAANAAQPSGTDGPKVLAYYTQYSTSDKGSYKSLAAYHRYIGQISTATFSIDAGGRIAGDTPESGLKLAGKYAIDTYAAVNNMANDRFDPDVAHRVLTEPAARAAALNSIESLVAGSGYRGVNIDFENMPAADRADFTSFIKDLSERLRAKGLKTIVSVTAKTSDSPKAAWSGAFDYAALGQAADGIQLMTYDENGSWGDPGPVASLPWVESVIKYAVRLIPPEKLYIGLPAYGYDWNVSSAQGNKAVSWRQVQTLLEATGAVPRWDESARSPYAVYSAEDGTQHIVWYENGDSIRAKAELAVRYGLGGVSVWRMGQEDDAFWEAVSAGLQPNKN